MSITYPLTPPASPGYNSRQLTARTVVGMEMSPFTAHTQVFAWPGQWLQFDFGLPPMKDAQAGAWSAFFMALNGPEGTFYLGDSIRKTPRGTVAGAWQVGAGATANSRTLPLVGGIGVAAVGDWLQAGEGAAARLHRVLQVNTSGGAMVSVEVFPRLRAAYTEDALVTWTNPKGIFRLVEIPPEAFDNRRICAGLNFTAVEVIHDTAMVAWEPEIPEEPPGGGGGPEV